MPTNHQNSGSDGVMWTCFLVDPAVSWEERWWIGSWTGTVERWSNEGAVAAGALAEWGAEKLGRNSPAMWAISCSSLQTGPQSSTRLALARRPMARGGAPSACR